MITKHLPF